MATSMHSTMRTELREHPERVYETVTFTIAGTSFSYGPVSGGVIRNDAGLFEPGLISRGSILRRASWPSYGLSEPRVTFKIYDETRALQKHFGGRAQGEVKDGTVDLRWRSNNVSSANHFQVVNGVIKDHRMVEERVFEIVAGVNDTPIKSLLRIPRLSRDVWAKIPTENEDLPGAVYLGNWLSTGVPNAQGMVKAVLVNEETGLWYVSYGIMEDVRNIQVDGVSDPDFTVLGTGTAGAGPEVHAGRPYTLLQDTASTLRTISNTVTCDVVGPEKQGDGSGSTTLLDEPARMLRIVLANFAYNDWPVGAPTPTAGSWGWFSQTTSDANTPVDDASNDAADEGFFSAHNVTASMLITSDDKGIDVIRNWAQSFRCPVAWDVPFEITTIPINLNVRDPYPTEKIAKFKREITSIGQQSVGSDVVTANKTTYIFNSASGQFVKTRIDGNRFCSDRKEEPFEFTYGPAESV